MKPIICTESCIVPKGWGHELIIHNDEEYCGKILVFYEGAKFSMHYHIKKKETWYVNQGIFLFNWIDTDTAERHTQKLKKGDIVTISRGMPHQLEAITNGEIFEISTQHFDTDSYRVEKGN